MNTEQSETFTVHQVVEQHPKYSSAAPERFHWHHVINPKVGGIGVELAQQIQDRRHEWEVSGRQGTDPMIPGLQEALRLIARKAVVQVTVYRRQGESSAGLLPDSAGRAA